MAEWCPNCGRELEDNEKFCRQCGMPQQLAGEEATTWMLSPQDAPQSSETQPVKPSRTGPAGAPTSAAYMPPAYRIPTAPPAPYQPIAPSGHGIRLGEWLTGGWQIYKENWALMSVATLLGILVSACTLGILAGPMLMGLFAMAFKTMRGEQPVMNDLFNFRGRFLQAFLTFLIFFVANVALSGLGQASQLFNLIHLAITPIITIMLSMTMAHSLERRGDVVTSINDVVRTVFSNNWFSWWLVGVVMSAITTGGFFACGVGGLVTLPWMVCVGSAAYRDTFGVDDPNRTNQ